MNNIDILEELVVDARKEITIEERQAIINLISENKELKEENRFLKTHEYKSKCECCKEYFYHKRPNVLWCKKCRTKMYNINYYANLSEEKKRERAEKSKISMRKKRKLQSLLGKE